MGHLGRAGGHRAPMGRQKGIEGKGHGGLELGWAHGESGGHRGLKHPWIAKWVRWGLGHMGRRGL